MAQPAVKGSNLVASAAIAAVSTLVATALWRPLSGVEEWATSVKYAVRGERQADTSLVIVYVDEPSIATLGWPVRRNFYALTLKVMTELRVRAVGLEPVFEDARPEYQEYDDLLCGMARTAGNVVLTSYFDRVGMVGSLPVSASEASPSVRLVPLQGEGLHRPFPALREAAAGVGHVNFTEHGGIPLLLQSGRDLEPAFSLELMRLSTGRKVLYDGGVVSLIGEKDALRLPAPEAVVGIDHPGGMDSYRHFPLLEVLRAYDVLRAGGTPALPITSFRDKIVLIGVIAEGRSQFVSTPLGPRLPTIAVHGAALDNMLQSRIPSEAPAAAVLLAAFLLAAATAGLVVWLQAPGNLLAAMGAIAGAIVVAVALFAAGTGIALVPLFTAGMASTLVSLVYRQWRARQTVEALGYEKEKILQDLRDREAKLATLERELAALETGRLSDRTAELLEEIRRSKAEIRALSSRADDMEPYVPWSGEAPGAVREFEGIIHASDGPMRRVVEFVAKIADADAPVLVLGESGTGKELIARAIHRRSRRASGPFIAVNCGALSEHLLESELFGHEKGAFTGAVKERLGRFELADGGTIFLDEIGETSDSFQVKLLRVLQQGELERVGGSTTIRVDVRVLAATNKDLKEQVRLKKFREDLYYRLNVLVVELAPLRERPEDIALLVEHFLQREGRDLRISRNVIDTLRSYSWPGNVRELESTLQRAVLLTRADGRTMVTVGDLGGEVTVAARNMLSLEDQVLPLVREKAFSRSSVSQTADELGGLNRGTVAEYLRGEFLKTFSEQRFDIERTVQVLSLSSESAVNERVRRRLLEYLDNLRQALDRSKPWEETREGLRPKTKNLPQRYHRYLEEVAEAYYRGMWDVPGDAGPL